MQRNKLQALPRLFRHSGLATPLSAAILALKKQTCAMRSKRHTFQLTMLRWTSLMMLVMTIDLPRVLKRQFNHCWTVA